MLSEYVHVYRGLLREVRKAVSIYQSIEDSSPIGNAGTEQTKPHNCVEFPLLIGAITKY